MSQYIADFHIHSKYSRATSKNMVLEELEQWAKIKGIQILGTGDFTHPFWFKELKEKLIEDKPGLFKLKSTPLNPPLIKGGRGGVVNFIITGEISCIYSQGGKTRRLHILVFAPSLEIVEKINLALAKIGNIRSDGRPILGLSAKKLAEIVLNVSKECLVIPAHAWTPWFSVFGSYSGFDSLQECFEDLTPQIYSIETGLSSDPAMNWRLSALDKITLISNSDAHSPENLGREANVFEILESELSYQEICRILKEKDKNKFLYTIEFFPEEGKYHWDGHRVCQISFGPKETKKNKGICPVCKRPLTIGVLNRVDILADRDEGAAPTGVIPYKSLVPLPEIIATTIGQAKNTKKVVALYNDLIKKGGNEFKILLDLPIEELKTITESEIALGIANVRQGKIKVEPGYDGVYGKVSFLENLEKVKPAQKKLF